MSCETTKLRIPRWVDRIFLIAGLGLLAFVVTRFPFADVLAACARVGPVFAVTPFIALGWFSCNTAGLYTLLGGRVPFRVLLWNRLVGDGYNALLPLGGFGGEPFKLRHLSEFVPAEQALTAMLRDRLTENAVGFSFSAAWLTLGVSRFAHGGALRIALLGYAIVAFVVSICYATALSTRLPGRLGAAAARWLGIQGEAVEPISAGRLLTAASFYLLGRVLGLVEITALFALLGLPFDPLTIGFAYSALQAVGFIAFFIPQGLGVLEGTSTWLFALLGFPGALGVAFVFARRGRLLLVSVFGVLLHVGARAATAMQTRRDEVRP
jgi:Lysylphosphatidylglycerol synthase TM region